MLILSRRAGESIYIGENIKLMVISAHSENGKITVRVGIDAPKEVNILREEVKLRNEQQMVNGNEQSGKTPKVQSKDTRPHAQKVQGKGVRSTVQKAVSRGAEQNLGKSDKVGESSDRLQVSGLNEETRQGSQPGQVAGLLDATFETTRQAIDNLALKAK